jgi:hypothetical protein
VGHGAVRVRLDVTDVQAGALLRACGTRRFAWNWAVAKVKANADQWAAEATYGLERAQRARPLTFSTLAEPCLARSGDLVRALCGNRLVKPMRRGGCGQDEGGRVR